MATCSRRERAMNNRTTASYPTSVTDGLLGNGGWSCSSLKLLDGSATSNDGAEVSDTVNGSGSCTAKVVVPFVGVQAPLKHFGPRSVERRACPTGPFAFRRCRIHAKARKVPETNSPCTDCPSQRGWIWIWICRCFSVVRQTVLAAWHAQSDDSGPARCNNPPVQSGPHPTRPA